MNFSDIANPEIPIFALLNSLGISISWSSREKQPAVLWTFRTANSPRLGVRFPVMSKGEPAAAHVVLVVSGLFHPVRNLSRRPKPAAQRNSLQLKRM